MITREQYFSKPHSDAQGESADELLKREGAMVNEAVAAGAFEIEIDPDTGTEISGARGGDGDGGFRTPLSPTGAPDSKHRKARALDRYDPKDRLDAWLDQFEVPMPNGGPGGNTKLEEYGLYRESPDKTPGWCHTQLDPPGSGRRTYVP